MTHARAGFTMVELAMAGVVLTLIMGSTFGVLLAGSRASTLAHTQIQARDEGRKAVMELSQRLREGRIISFDDHVARPPDDVEAHIAFEVPVGFDFADGRRRIIWSTDATNPNPFYHVYAWSPQVGVQRNALMHRVVFSRFTNANNPLQNQSVVARDVMVFSVELRDEDGDLLEAFGQRAGRTAGDYARNLRPGSPPPSDFSQVRLVDVSITPQAMGGGDSRVTGTISPTSTRLQLRHRQ